MRPLFKICIAASVVLFLFGITGVGVGLAMGVTPSDLMYAEHWPGRLFLQSSRPNASEAQMEAETYPLSEPIPSIPEELQELSGNNLSGAEEYYEFWDVDSLTMDLGLCDLHIYQHPNDHIAIAADNTKNYFRCSQEDHTLILEDIRPASAIGSNMNQALILDLYLPELQYQKISLDLGVGDITLVRLSVDELNIDSGTGDIFIGTLTCQELDVDTGAGEFTADFIQAFESADIAIGAGSITVSKYAGNALNLDCAVGNAEITAAGRETDYNYQLEAALGNIYLDHHLYDFSEPHHGVHHDEGSLLDIHHDADREIQISCGLGNAELNFTEESYYNGENE